MKSVNGWMGGLSGRFHGWAVPGGICHLNSLDQALLSIKAAKGAADSMDWAQYQPNSFCPVAPNPMVNNECSRIVPMMGGATFYLLACLQQCTQHTALHWPPVDSFLSTRTYLFQQITP